VDQYFDISLEKYRRLLIELTNNVLASWIYIGTGIFLTRENAEITEEEHFLGVIEPVDQGALNDLAVNPFDAFRENSDLLSYDDVNINDLVNVTDVAVLTADASPGGIAGGLQTPINVDGISVNTIEDLAQAIVGRTQGWIRDLPNTASAGAQATPSSRITGAAVTFNNQLFFSAFTPEGQTGIDICDGETGFSNIFALDQTTGTASTIGTFGDDNGEFGFMSDRIDGNISSPLIFNTEGLGANEGVIITQKENGALTPNSQDGDATNRINNSTDLRSSWREIN